MRIESPGQDFEVEKALLALGADVEDEDGAARIAAGRGGRACRSTGAGSGSPGSGILGFREALRLIDRQVSACPGHRRDESARRTIAVMFDKPRCHARPGRDGRPLPAALGPVRSLRGAAGADARGRGRPGVRQAGPRVVGLGRGRPGDGRPAGRWRRPRSEVVRDGGEVRLYNSRAIRRIEDEREVAALVDALAARACTSSVGPQGRDRRPRVRPPRGRDRRAGRARRRPDGPGADDEPAPLQPPGRPGPSAARMAPGGVGGRDGVVRAGRGGVPGLPARGRGPADRPRLSPPRGPGGQRLRRPAAGRRLPGGWTPTTAEVEALLAAGWAA